VHAPLLLEFLENTVWSIVNTHYAKELWICFGVEVIEMLFHEQKLSAELLVVKVLIKTAFFCYRYPSYVQLLSLASYLSHKMEFSS
jgi:hypothetical protein